MAKIVNLNKARKARDKVNKRARADENAVRFGRDLAQKDLDSAMLEKARKALDNHRREEE